MKMLNLGCGGRCDANWINIDFISHDPMVQQWDLSKGIPMASESCDVVYHSHVLEHFNREAGQAFVQECFRVLKKTGVIRVVIPDLEQLAVNYLQCLRRYAAHPSPMAAADHQWATIEMIDQMVRDKSGGFMQEYWSQPVIINEETVEARLGHEFTRWRNAYLEQKNIVDSGVGKATVSLFRRFRGSWRKYWLKRWGIDQKDLSALHFHTSGEKHKWMYDAISLKRLMEHCGFKQVQVTDAFNSRIPGWAQYQWLDLEAGHVRKPDSLFMEAIK